MINNVSNFLKLKFILKVTHTINVAYKTEKCLKKLMFECLIIVTFTKAYLCDNILLYWHIVYFWSIIIQTTSYNVNFLYMTNILYIFIHL